MSCTACNQEICQSSPGGQRKTVLFVCIGAISHVNSVLGMANHLREQGHRTAFLFNKPFASHLSRLGHEVYDCTSPDLVESPCEGPIPNITSDIIVDAGRESWRRGSMVESMEAFNNIVTPALLNEYKNNPYDDNVARKMELLRPNVLVLDHFFMYPALFKLNIPWVQVFSPAPLSLHPYEHELPQPWMGLPTKWDRKNPEHVEWNERARVARKRVYDEVMNPYWTSFGFPDLPTNPISLIPQSPYLRLYMYPEELDYEQPLEGWQRFDYSIRDSNINKFEIPPELKQGPGKLIFVSMGSLASADSNLMRRLIEMLSDCPHRFIVVTGSHGSECKLAQNMWGGEFLPQLEILQVIDLIITHGGNNTVCESFYYGVPGMIVCPLIGDQPDNAQRIQEKGLGIRLDPYNCTKLELHGAIEELLNRPGLKERMQTISRRMQAPETRNKPLRLISDFVNSSQTECSPTNCCRTKKDEHCC